MTYDPACPVNSNAGDESDPKVKKSALSRFWRYHKSKGHKNETIAGIFGFLSARPVGGDTQQTGGNTAANLTLGFGALITGALFGTRNVENDQKVSSIFERAARTGEGLRGFAGNVSLSEAFMSATIRARELLTRPGLQYNLS